MNVFNAEIEKHFVKETFKERKARWVYNHHNEEKREILKKNLKKLTLFDFEKIEENFELVEV
jgi:hypothetical protein